MPVAVRVRAIVCVVLIAVFLAGCNAMSCSQRPSETRIAEKPVEESQTNINDLLRKDRDLETCKTVVHQLNSPATSGRMNVAELSDEERTILEKEFAFTADEMREITGKDWTPLDANYLFQCLLLHDGLRTLGLTMSDEPAARMERLRDGFAWAMRQVWLSGQDGRPLPAVFVLKRGYGGDPERAAVAMAVFHQLGFEPCLIGREQAEGIRMWAVGVAVDSDILLFDPHRGKPISGPDGKIATLKQVRANPELVKDLEIREKIEPAVFVKESKVYLAPSLSALSPRAKALEEMLTLQPPVRLATSASQTRKRYAQLGESAIFWNPKNETGTLVRSLAHFLPTDEGGFDRTPRGSCQYDIYRNRLAPRALMPPIFAEDSIAGEPGRLLRTAFTGRFVALFDLPNHPRDLLLRGQLDEATQGLVENLRQINVNQERVNQEARLEADAQEWVQKMRSASARLERAQIRPGEVDVAEAKAQVDNLFKNSSKVNLYLEKAVAHPFGTHVTFQLALCKHEQAWRQAKQFGNSAATTEAWETAAGWWRNFLNNYDNVTFLPKGIVEHARNLLAEAAAGAGKSKP